MKIYPKTLVIAINAWKDNSVINTLLNLFRNWDSDKLSLLYTKSDLPETNTCKDYFQISEISVIKHLFNPKVKIGRHFTKQSLNSQLTKEEELLQKSEVKHMAFGQTHRSSILSLIRESIWALGTWKNRELKSFLDNGKWDVVFCPVYAYIYMNIIQAYVLKRTGLKGVAFIGDDNYSYTNCGYNPFAYIHRYFLRLSIKRVMKQCYDTFVMVPKMQLEYDRIFGIKSKLLTKGIDFESVHPIFRDHEVPLKIIYTGKVIIGRDKSLAAIAHTLKELNKNNTYGELHIYTQTEITSALKDLLEIPGASYLHAAVPYDEMFHILEDADIVTFVESLEPKYKHIARLSFSTKITDYFKSAKCIFAVGADDIAPIEYLKDKDAAIICCSYDEIKLQINNIVKNPQLVKEYSIKAYECGLKYHNSLKVEEQMYNVLSKAISK